MSKQGPFITLIIGIVFLIVGSWLSGGMSSSGGVIAFSFNSAVGILSLFCYLLGVGFLLMTFIAFYNRYRAGKR
jgi:hypothetical protein